MKTLFCVLISSICTYSLFGTTVIITGQRVQSGGSTNPSNGTKTFTITCSGTTGVCMTADINNGSNDTVTRSVWSNPVNPVNHAAQLFLDNQPTIWNEGLIQAAGQLLEVRSSVNGEQETFTFTFEND